MKDKIIDINGLKFEMIDIHDHDAIKPAKFDVIYVNPEKTIGVPFRPLFDQRYLHHCDISNKASNSED